MTTDITVSVNGNYQVPVRQGAKTTIVSGRDHEGPNAVTFSPTHGDGAVIHIGPETLDTGVAQEREQTYGEKAVGLTFNPSGDTHVHHCKRLHAELIDQMAKLRDASVDGEQKRLASVAITELQTAQMWGVKALTWRL